MEVEMDNITMDDLRDPEKLKQIEAELAKLYPDIDFSQDIGKRILEKYRDEFDEFVDGLIAKDKGSS
jgi:hypothetical protein